MKKTAAIVLILAAAIAAAPLAHAGDKERALIGGLIGGIIIGSALDNDRHHSHTRVVVRDSHRHHDRCGCSGHYEWVSTRIWIPVNYVTTYDSCGRRIRVREGGHYTYRKERVWVADHGHGRGRDRIYYSDRDDRYDRHDRYDRGYRR